VSKKIEILHVFSRMIQNEIREDINNEKFWLLLSETHVNIFVNERFLDIVHVQDNILSNVKQ
jgi:hypothetical protein